MAQIETAIFAAGQQAHDLHKAQENVESPHKKCTPTFCATHTIDQGLGLSPCSYPYEGRHTFIVAVCKV